MVCNTASSKFETEVSSDTFLDDPYAFGIAGTGGTNSLASPSELIVVLDLVLELRDTGTLAVERDCGVALEGRREL